MTYTSPKAFNNTKTVRLWIRLREHD